MKLHAPSQLVSRQSDAPASVDVTRSVRVPPHDGVTLLRAVICLSIVIVHLQPGGPMSWPDFLPFQWTPEWMVTHARPGFESFFVLAGYFLAHSFRPGSWQTFSVFGFYRRRVIRLLLPYWLILIISWMGAVAYAVRHHGVPDWSPPGFWRQMLLMHNLEVNDLVAPQLWFMAPLIQFYLGWGIVFWLARKACVRFRSEDVHRAAIRVMMVVVAVTYLASILTDAYRGGLDFTLFTNAHYLALGCLIYWHTNARVGIGWLLCALGMETALGLAINQSRPVATILTCLLLVHAAGRVFSAGPKLAWALVIGRCSYSIYLTHMFVGWRAMGLFAILLGGKADFWGQTVLTWLAGVVGCVLGGYVYNRLVEQPCARWARKIEYRRVADTPADPGRLAQQAG